MIRLHVCSASLSAGICVALLVPGLQSGRCWDSRESKSALFHPGTSPYPKTGACVSTAQTLSKWERPHAAHAPGKALTAQLQPTGARLSLVSLRSTTSVLEACGAGPDYAVPAATSVTGPPPNTANCSSFAGPPPNALGQCSVQFANPNPPPVNTPNCSSTGSVANGGNGPCSAGSGSPVNIGNGNNTTFCSATQGVAGAGNATSCTAADSAGMGSQCSAFQGPGNVGSYCSVGNTGGNSTCSTGVTAAPNGLGGTCSTFQSGATPKGNPAAQCSVKTDSQGSNCSCTVAGQSCSVGSNNAGDFCSVQADPNNFNQCTTLAGQAAAGTCSVIPPSTAAPTQCSGAVSHADGTCSSR